MRVLVTGAAGFIGSTLVDTLLGLGHKVLGVDCFTDYYDPEMKRRNLTEAESYRTFELHDVDISAVPLDDLVIGTDVIFHQAGQPGVRASWSEGFENYVRNNIRGTQRLLESARKAGVSRFVYASSSSIYGNTKNWPTREDALPEPYSPYGVTKLAAEHMCNLYARNFGLSTVSLRYFTVYGPRQRPDMATHRLIESSLFGVPFPLYGDGSNIRDFTFVGDVVQANLAAASADVAPGTYVNVAGGSSCSMMELIDLVTLACGSAPNVTSHGAAQGDVDRTGGDIKRASQVLSWRPETALSDGIKQQVAWHKSRRGAP